MSKLTDQAYLRGKQYRDAGNLNARITLHILYSTNPYAWMRWVFDRFNLPPDARILEIGCGPGTLWAENLERIPYGWDITLSDYSPGMVEQAHRNLAPAERPFRFLALDAQQIPFSGEHFDAVVANHMLYHVPDRERGIAEVHRVLRPGGRLYASTVGRRHLRELSELVYRFEPDGRRDIDIWRLASAAPDGAGLGNEPFELENGADELERRFAPVVLHRYDDALAVTEAGPLVDYVLSTASWADTSSDKVVRFTEYVEAAIRAHGAIHITKDSGMFEAVKGERA